MTSVRRRMGNLGAWILTASALSSGCLSFCHPIAHPSVEEIRNCSTLPPCSRNHVHVFLVNGMDPLDIANLSGVRDYLVSIGFIKTYHGQVYHTGTMARDIRRLHREDPDAHFALIGYGYGANRVRELANALRTDGIFVDLVVYFGANGAENSQETRPDNIGRVVNLRTKSENADESFMNDALNITYSDVSSFGAPAHPYTLETLARELMMVASAVPIIETLPAPAVPSRVPTMPRAADRRDDWDFLKYRSAFEQAPTPTLPPPPPPTKEPAPLPSSIGRI
jgi:hypothetical protein